MTGTMPNTPKAMEPEYLRKLMEVNGVPSADDLAVRLEVHRTTVFRWLAGSRRIDRAAAALITSVLKKKPKE
jgi:DNA-binding transcriptional regulator YiaG